MVQHHRQPGRFQHRRLLQNTHERREDLQEHAAAPQPVGHAAERVGLRYVRRHKAQPQRDQTCRINPRREGRIRSKSDPCNKLNVSDAEQMVANGDVALKVLIRSPLGGDVPRRGSAFGQQVFQEAAGTGNEVLCCSTERHLRIRGKGKPVGHRRSDWFLHDGKMGEVARHQPVDDGQA